MMPTLGAPELIIILVIIVLIFGAGKLPEVGQALGKGIREFRGATDGADDDEPATPAAKPAAVASVAVEAPRPAPAVVAPTTQPVTAPVAAPLAAPVAAPVAASTAAASVAYTVNAGDTPDTVAQSHGVTVEELLAANGWSQRDRVLYPGDKIQVPAKGTTV
jgi:sec-independent protein translocase protein TatA